MPDFKDERDEERTPPSRAEQSPTPHGTPDPSHPTAELNIPDSTLQAFRGRFELLAEIGRGGMGIVYKARDRETNETVALKVLKPEIASRPDLIERFKSELRLARKITHKNVCRTYDLHRFGNTVIIAMEYVEGESLRATLSRPAGVALRPAQQWVAQICSALAEAHAQGVVHRDLKPENIFIDRQGNIKVMDFGIARSLDAEATQTGGVMGTPAYMSPEQAEGKPADARSDIYSLGLVMYEMFTGRPAFKADTPVALAVKQIHETPPPPREVEPDLPARIDRAVEKCLEKNPKKRFQSVSELEAALAGRPEAMPAVPAGEEELPFHLTHWQRSDWLLVCAAIPGLALFFPFFNRTSLAPLTKVYFDRSLLIRIAEEHLQRIGSPLGTDAQIGSLSDWTQYSYVARTYGAPKAREVLYWGWYVEWQHPGRRPTRLQVDNHGSLTAFSRDFPETPKVEKIPLDEARSVAERAIRDFFKRDPSGLTLESAGGDVFLGRGSAGLSFAGTTFVWEDPRGYHGLRQRYLVRLVGREIAVLDARPEVPPGYIATSPWARRRLTSLAGLALLALGGFLLRRRVPLSAKWRVWMVAVVVAMMAKDGLSLFRDFDIVRKLFFSVALALLMGLVFLLASIAIEQLVRKFDTPKFASLTRLFSLDAASEPSGLAILRGTFVGLALLGLDTFMVWVGTVHLGMWLDEVHIAAQAKLAIQPWRPVSIVLDAMREMLIVGFVIPPAVYLVTRFVKHMGLAALVAASLGAGIGLHMYMASLGSAPLGGVMLLLVYLVLVWAFVRFDILTLLWTVFTFAFCWQNYRLLVMLEPTGSVQEWIAFAVWGLFVLGAAAVAFKTSLRAGYRRAAAAFE